jgi:hypothetical protein
MPSIALPVSRFASRADRLWREVPAGTALIVGEDIEEQAFRPITPTAA